MDPTTQPVSYQVVTDIRDLTDDGQQTWRVLARPIVDVEQQDVEQQDVEQQDVEQQDVEQQDLDAEEDVLAGQEVDGGTFPVTEDEAGTLAALDVALTASGWIRTGDYDGDTFTTSAAVARR